MNKHKKDETKKRVTAGAAAAIASAGLVVGGLFQSPADLLDDPIDTYMVTINDNADDDLDSGGDDGEDSVTPEEKRKSMAARARMRILAMPMAVRVIFVLPLWCVGWVLISLGTALWGSVLSPAMTEALRWVCIALMILLVLTVGIKTAFPNTPIARILNRRTVGTLILGMMLVGAVEVLLGVFMPDKENITRLVTFISSGCVLIVSCVPILFRPQEEKESSAAAEEEAVVLPTAEEYIDPDIATRRLAEEIADTYMR